MACFDNFVFSGERRHRDYFDNVESGLEGVWSLIEENPILDIPKVLYEAKCDNCLIDALKLKLEDVSSKVEKNPALIFSEQKFDKIKVNSVLNGLLKNRIGNVLNVLRDNPVLVAPELFFKRNEPDFERNSEKELNIIANASVLIVPVTLFERTKAKAKTDLGLVDVSNWGLSKALSWLGGESILVASEILLKEFESIEKAVGAVCFEVTGMLGAMEENPILILTEGVLREIESNTDLNDSAEIRIEKVWGAIRKSPVFIIPDQLSAKVVSHMSLDGSFGVERVAVAPAIINDLPQGGSNSSYRAVKEFLDNRAGEADCGFSVSADHEVLHDDNLAGTVDEYFSWGDILAIGEQPLLHNETSENIDLISVDFNASERILLSQFRFLIKEKKKLITISAQKKYNMKVKQQKSYTPSEMRSWANDRVLPYIDLMIYEKIKKKRIPRKKLVKLLFPNYLNRDEYFITETVKVKADRLMDTKTIVAMEHELSVS